MKFFILIGVVLLTISCSNNTILDCDYDRIKFFYLGLNNVTIHKLTDCEKLKLSDLRGLPKYADHDHLMSHEWELLTHKKEPFKSLEYIVPVSISTTINIENKKYANSLLEKMKSNPEIFYISGFYDLAKAPNGSEYKQYDYYFVLNSQENLLIEFDYSQW